MTSLRKAAPQLDVWRSNLFCIMKLDLKQMFFFMGNQSSKEFSFAVGSLNNQTRRHLWWMWYRPMNNISALIKRHRHTSKMTEFGLVKTSRCSRKQTNNCNYEKVMVFVIIVDGKDPIVHPFVDENSRNVAVNGACYLDLINDPLSFMKNNSPCIFLICSA